jgi:hypothetical protein
MDRAVAVPGEVDPDRGLRPDVDVNVMAARVEPAAEALAGSLKRPAVFEEGAVFHPVDPGVGGLADLVVRAQRLVRRRRPSAFTPFPGSRPPSCRRPPIDPPMDALVPMVSQLDGAHAVHDRTLVSADHTEGSHAQAAEKLQGRHPARRPRLQARLGSLHAEAARAPVDRRLRVLVREAHELGRPAYGSPRIHRELAAQGLAVGRKRIIRLMQAEGIVGRARRRYKNTTDSAHNLPVAPNLLDRQFEAQTPNQRWVGDTTELRIGDGNAKLYLAAILDLFSRFIVGWAVSAVNDRHLVLKALDMAIRRRCPGSGLVHHSDRGSPTRARTTRGPWRRAASPAA